jgi:hypothetical protein
MLRSIFRFVALVSLLAFAAAQNGAAQSGQSGQSQGQSQEQAQPATQPQAPPPETQAGATPNAAAKTEPSKTKKPKKVWTEEDVGKLDSKVSVVGNSNSAAGLGSPSGGSSLSGSGSRDASSYRNRLIPLRQQLENIDKQIRDLQNAKLGGRANIARPLERLETQKKDVQAKIDAIEDEARKNGVEPGQLR